MNKKYFRQKTIGIILIISMAVSCFVLVNIADLLAKITREYKANKIYSNTMTAIIGNDRYIESEELIFGDVIDYLCKCKEGNVYVETLVTVGNKREEYTVTIVMAQNMKIIEKDVDAKLLSAPDSVFIGETLRDTIEEYMSIGNTPVSVVGTLKNTMASGIDNRFYIIYENCSQQLKDYLHYRMGYTMTVIMQGEKNVESQFKDFASFVRDNNFYCRENISEGVGGFENTWYKITNGVVFVISFVFSVINVYIVSELWLKSRSREIAIRKAYGYSEGMLFRLLYKDTLLHGVVGMVITLIVQHLYKFISEKVMLDIITVIEIVGVFVGMLIIALINVIRMQKQIRNIETARFLARRER